MARMPQLFFNAHGHLELSHLRGAIAPGLPFAEWLSRLVPLKRASLGEQSVAGVAAALHEMRATGTVAFLDIDSIRSAIAPIQAVGQPAISFTEVIEFDPALGGWAVDEAGRHQATHGPMRDNQAFGISPHAPYTTSPRLLRAALAHAQAHDQWLCLHAAESPEETDFLMHGRGGLRDLLEGFGVLPPKWEPPGLRPIPYLATHGVLGPKTLLVHVNDVTDEEIALLARSQTRVVVCPGTHVYFGRGEFPLARLMNGGVETYIGTDSLASNESLDMTREILIACDLCPDLDPDRIGERAAAERARDFGLDPTSAPRNL